MHFINTFIDSIDIFTSATLVTLQLTAVSILLAIVLGLFIAILKLTNIKILNWIADIYIWIIRGTPLVVQIFVLYYGMTSFFLLSAFWSAAIALGIHNGAYIAEIFRGAVQSIDKGQREAGYSLGMSLPLTMRRIILPQAFRRSLPSLANQFIINLKDSAIAAFIGMQELFGTATSEGSNNFDYLTFYLIVAVYYLVLVLVLTFLVNRLEKRLARQE